MLTILWSFGIWSKLETKTFDKWVPHELTENLKKIIILKCHLLLFYITTRHFSTGLWCETKNGFYMKTGNDQLSGWTEKKLQNTSQSQTCTKKRSWSLFGGLLPVWHTTAFWILVKSLHLRSMLSKSMRCTKNCNAYNQHWSTERAQFFSTTKVQPHVTQPMLQKLKELGYEVLTHLPYSSVLSPINYHFLKHRHNFLQKNAATTSRIQKIFAKSLLNPEAWIFIIQNKQTYFSSYSD